MKVIFAGTPEFAALALQAIHEAGFEIALVLTQPDRPAGRGMHLQASAVKEYALQHHLSVAQPISLKLNGKYPDIAQEAHQLLHDTPHDVMVVAAYGLILPTTVLSIPKHGCLNIHGSLLPRWRGAAPIHRAIEAGDSETGITIMQMDEGLDTGAMISMEKVAISDQATTASLHDELAHLGAKMIVDALEKLKLAPLPSTPQGEEGVCYAEKISKQEAALDFEQSATVLSRKIRALNPFPGAVATLNDSAIKIWNAQAHTPTQAINAKSGQIIQANAEQGLQIACDEGRSILHVTELQKAGGKRLNAQQFLQGHPNLLGQHFQGHLK
jgi:methionyl-tRNA formyltransferase